MRTIERNQRPCAGAIAACALAIAGAFALPASAAIVTAVEYYHKDFEHYFVTPKSEEISALDAGAIQGWWRTGQRYRVDDAPSPGLAPVCRFYTGAFAGKASHFFTASAEECEQLKTSPFWTYEGVAFYAQLPDDEGICNAGTTPVYRLYNDGHGGAPNHAYTAHVSKRDQLVGASAWVPEGVAYCVPLAGADPMAHTMMLAGSSWEFPVSENGWSPMPTYFQNGASAGPFVNRHFADFGLSAQPVTISHSIPHSEYWGAASWDPIVGEYILVGDVRGWGGPEMRGFAWTFDNAMGPTIAACAMVVHKNFLDVHRTLLHYLQPYLWSGCVAVVATKR